MTPRSLAWRTDLALLQQSGSTVEDHDDHLVIRTPTNPTFHWGNCVLLREAPAAGDGARWVSTFERSFPDAEHLSIGVDAPVGSTADLAPLAEVGLEVDLSVVLTRSPGGAPTAPAVRTLESDQDWAERVALSIARYPSDEPGHDEFVRRRAAASRASIGDGHGAWWGAFDGDRLLSSAGIFLTADGELARFQDVETHPDAERRGLASAVLTAAASYAGDRGATTLVIVADPEDGAVRLYRRLGFTDAEVQLTAARPDH